MPKRRLPPPPKLWARQLRTGEWEIYLPTGETLREVDDVEIDEARELARTLRMIHIGYLQPAVEITGDTAAIANEFAPPDPRHADHLFNSFSVFASAEGIRALVSYHNH